MGEPPTSLTANDYYAWSRRAAWSELDAAYLLSGFCPPSQSVDESRTTWLTDEIRSVCRQAKEYPNLLIPLHWVQLALDLGVESDACIDWEAIFPFARSQTIMSICEWKPDYRDFWFSFLRDTEMELGELARFAHNLSWEEANQDSDIRGGRFDIKEYRNLLRFMAKQFDVEGLPLTELEQTPIKARAFLGHYPRSDFNLDERCDRWVTWIDDHSKLANLLRLPLSNDNESMTGAKPVTLQRRDEGTQAAIALLRRLDEDGNLPDRQSLKATLAKSNVADEIENEPALYPACHAYMKYCASRKEYRNFAQRYPSLARDWPDFAENEAVVSTLETLNS